MPRPATCRFLARDHAAPEPTPPPHQGRQRSLDATSGLVLATQKSGGITGSGIRREHHEDRNVSRRRDTWSCESTSHVATSRSRPETSKRPPSSSRPSAVTPRSTSGKRGSRHGRAETVTRSSSMRAPGAACSGFARASTACGSMLPAGRTSAPSRVGRHHGRGQFGEVEVDSASGDVVFDEIAGQAGIQHRPRATSSSAVWARRRSTRPRATSGSRTRAPSMRIRRPGTSASGASRPAR